MPDVAEMIEERKVAPIMVRAANVRPNSYQEEDNSIEITWTTGAAGLRFDWYNGEYYIEELSLEPGAVRLDRLNNGACLLDSHQDYTLRSVLGSVVPGTAKIEGGEGSARVRLATTPDVADTNQKIIDGHIRSVSVGYLVYTYQRTEKEGERPHLLATDWEPIELSMVAVPFDAGAQVRARSAEQGGNPCIIRGLAAASQEIIMPDPVIEPATPPAPPVDQNRNQQTPPAPPAPPAVTAKRIRELCARSEHLGDEFALELIERNEEKPLTEADLLHAVNERLFEKSKKPTVDVRAGVTGTETEGYRQALEDAIALRANPGLTLEAPRIQAAAEFRGMTLIETARDYLQRTGIRPPSSRLELAGEALGMRYGAMTSSDFAIALASASNKRVRAAFQAAKQTFRPIISTGTLPDFKPTNIVGLGDAPALLLVPENGEFKRGAISDTGLSYQLQTYGRIIAITRQAIVNDDMRLFGRIPTMFGRKAADLESDLVWGLLLSNPTMGDGTAMFHANHGNLMNGSAISVTSLGAGRAMMRKQKSDEGGYISVEPTYLIVGPDQELAAQQVLAAVLASATADVNPFAGSLTLIVEPRITGNQWYLSASPDAFDTIELSHLLGQEELFTDTRVGFDVDGVENKARLDVGAAVIDYRGFVKNPGQ